MIARVASWWGWVAFSCLAGGVVGRAALAGQLRVGFLLILLPAGFLLLRDRRRAGSDQDSVAIACFLVGLAGFTVILTYNINQAWVDHHGFNGAVWSIFSRAILRYGFAATQGLCYWTGGPELNALATVYDHHPPGLPWMLALAFGVFGVHEWVARLIPIVFTVAALAGMGAVVGRRYGSRAMGALLLVAAASPAVTFFGRMVNFEPLILSLAILFYAARIVLQPGRARDAVLLVIMAMAPATGWVGIPFAAIAAGIVLRETCARGGLVRRLFWIVPLGSTLFAILYASRWGASASTVWSRAWAWNSTVNTSLPTYSLVQLANGIIGNVNELTPWPLWLAIPLLGIRGIRAGVDWRSILGVVAPFLLLVPIMPNAVYAHDYHMMFWWPALAVVVACSVSLLADRKTALFALGVFLLYPVHLSFGHLENRHTVGVYARHQVKTGSRINEITEPAARVAIVNTAGDLAPILAYSMDRDYQVFNSLAAAVKEGTFDYYCLLHKSRGVSEAELDDLKKIAGEVPESGVRLYRSANDR